MDAETGATHGVPEGPGGYHFPSDPRHQSGAPCTSLIDSLPAGRQPGPRPAP